MTNVAITNLHDNRTHPGIVYCNMKEVDNDDGVFVHATLNYCLNKANEEGYVVANAQEVLMWLNRHTDIVPYSQEG